MKFLLTLLLLISGGVFAQVLPSPSTQARPKITVVVQNKDFVKYAKPKRVRKQGQVEMIYFYYYGSPWTYQIDKSLRRWAATRPYAINFVAVPLYFNNNSFGILGARVHYALVLLGEEERLSPLFMQAVHQGMVNLGSVPSVLNWMESHGIAQSKFLKALNDPRTKSSTISLPFVAARYDVTSVPSIVLDGQYLISANEKRTPQHVLEVAKFMSDKLAQGGKRP